MPSFEQPNYTPDMKNYQQGAFRFWCQTVMPLAYDDSLSYYELLNKIVNYLNSAIQDIRSTTSENTNSLLGAYSNLEEYVSTKTQELTNAYNELEEYISVYFDQLDVQQEINTKLDQMAASGYFNNIITPLIPSAVTAWLDLNVTPISQAVVIDDSLSISGACADAKTTGTYIRTIQHILNYLGITGNVAWEEGMLSLTTGQPVVLAGWIRTSEFIPVNDTDHALNFIMNESIAMYSFRIYQYDANKDFIRTDIYHIYNYKYNMPFNLEETTKYIKFAMHHEDSTPITVDESLNLIFYWDNSEINTFVNEKISNKIDKCENLYNHNTDIEGSFINIDGSIRENASFKYSDYIAVKGTHKYKITCGNTEQLNTTFRIHEYRLNNNNEYIWVSQIGAIDWVSTENAGLKNITVTISANCSAIRISMRKTSYGISVTEANNYIYNYANDKLIPLYSTPLAGKKLSILGASISTFRGYIVEGMTPFYPKDTYSTNWVDNVNDTYWMKVINSTGMELLVNNSSSGSYCTTGHGNDDLAGCGSRCENLDSNNVNPDVIIIQLGGNDFTRNTDIGTYNGSQTFPNTTNTFREAYATMLNKITTKYKNALVLCGTIPIIKGGTYVSSTFPAKNNSNVLLETFNEAIRELSKLFGCEVVEFSRCGITFNNVDVYMQDYSGGYGQHPNILGHTLMADAVLKKLREIYNKTY